MELDLGGGRRVTVGGDEDGESGGENERGSRVANQTRKEEAMQKEGVELGEEAVGLGRTRDGPNRYRGLGESGPPICRVTRSEFAHA